MTTTLAIGDFSRATHLSIKMPRHYHDIGLLEPTDVDPDTGYRRYAPDLEARNRVIVSHLARLETNLGRTQGAVASLRDLLEQPSASPSFHHRCLPATPAAAITQTVRTVDALIWYQGALAELAATMAAQYLDPAGSAGGIFADELFAQERGEATIFVPCAQEVRPMGRVAPLIIPPVELATIVHPGPHAGIDRAYGALGAYVTQHAMGIDGPIREYYLVGPTDTDDVSTWRTEVGWPIFHTRPVS
jgi:effector-binding domain-containing protein